MSNTYAHRPIDVVFPNGVPDHVAIPQFSTADKYGEWFADVRRVQNRKDRYAATRALAKGGLDALDDLPTRSASRSRAKWLTGMMS